MIFMSLPMSEEEKPHKVYLESKPGQLFLVLQTIDPTVVGIVVASVDSLCLLFADSI